MEFYLSKDVEVRFWNLRDSTLSLITSEEITVKPEPREEMEEHVRGIYLERLDAVVSHETINKTNFVNKSHDDVKLQVLIAFSADLKSTEEKEGKGPTMNNAMNISCLTNIEGKFLERVFNAFKVESNASGISTFNNAAIRWYVRMPSNLQGGCLIHSTDPNKIDFTSSRATSFGKSIFKCQVPEEIPRSWKTGSESLMGKLTVILMLNDAAVNSLFVRNLSPFSLLTALREMLGNEAEADAEIIPGGDGARPVKCHRAFLASRSPVFRAMFQSGMEEATTNKIKVPEMSESVTRTFIKYLYTFDVEAPSKQCYLALEMLKAGNCYDVADLQTAMFELFMMKPANWFNVDVALDLFLYTRNLINGTKAVIVNAAETKKVKLIVSESTIWKDLNLKAVKTLTWFSKTVLMTPEHFKRFEKENPQLAFSLRASLIKRIVVNK